MFDDFISVVLVHLWGAVSTILFPDQQFLVGFLNVQSYIIAAINVIRIVRRNASKVVV
jgi:hypothetical protein